MQYLLCYMVNYKVLFLISSWAAAPNHDLIQFSLMQSIQIGYMMLIHVSKVLSLDYQPSENARPERVYEQSGIYHSDEWENFNFSFILIFSILIDTFKNTLQKIY